MCFCEDTGPCHIGVFGECQKRNNGSIHRVVILEEVSGKPAEEVKPGNKSRTGMEIIKINNDGSAWLKLPDKNLAAWQVKGSWEPESERRPKKGDLVMVRDYDIQDWILRIHAGFNSDNKNLTMSFGNNNAIRYVAWKQWRFPTDDELKQLFGEE